MPGFTLIQLNAIEEGIASGSTSVSYEGKSVSFRSLDEMLRVRDIIMRALGLTPKRPSTVLAAHNRGYLASRDNFGDDSK